MAEQFEEKARGVPPEIVAEEAAKLRALFEKHTDFTQAEFGEKFGIGSQSAVWQYLSGRRSLNVNAADAFSKGLHVPIESFSPRIVQEIRQKATMMAKLLEHDDYFAFAGHGVYESSPPYPVDARIAALPEALRAYVMLSLQLAEAAQPLIPTPFLTPPTSESYHQFHEYLMSLGPLLRNFKR